MASWMALVVKNPPANARDTRDVGLIPGLGRFPWRRKRQPTPVFLPGKFQGQRNLQAAVPGAARSTEHTHIYWYMNIYNKKRPP